MTDLRCAMNDYLTVRRQLGFQLRDTERTLADYLSFCEDAGEQHITTELAVRWATSINAHPHRWRRRLGVVRGFARYVSTIDPATEIPSEDLLRASLPRVAPYLYSQTEITALMNAAKRLTPSLRAASVETIVGLLAVSGLRVGEALGLDRGDVDLHDAALHVRAAKGAKQREVPLHDNTTRALRDYSRLRDQHVPEPHSLAFFLSPVGTRITSAAFNANFRTLIEQTGLEGHGQRARPRPHDLRHSLDVRTLIDWYHADEDIDRLMPLLSTFLGHIDPASTYWYLEASPELLALARDRLERGTGRLS
jgi:integrase/recombinase XerD